jgi:hypothetical protein
MRKDELFVKLEKDILAAVDKYLFIEGAADVVPMVLATALVGILQGLHKGSDEKALQQASELINQVVRLSKK